MKKQIKEQKTTITINVSTRQKLNIWKYKLKCKTIDELIDLILEDRK